MTTVSIFGVEPSVKKELFDVCALFFSSLAMAENEDADLDIRIAETVADKRRFSLRISGRYAYESTLSCDVCADILEDKRVAKRTVKLGLYHALKQKTGVHPPWGALTGIRPTRLMAAAMEKGKTLDEAACEMQALFDVTPQKAQLLKHIVQTQQGITPPAPDEVDVYVGIPFCRTRCSYCSFLAGEVGNGALLAPYVDALVEEIAQSVKLADEAGLRVRTFYMGGGTPTALTAPLLDRVLDAALPLMSRASEVTVEAGRPDTLDENKLNIIRDHGASRISINPQTMHDETLRFIGRDHTRRQTEDAYALARRLGFEDINMDVIVGLPRENEAMVRQTFDWVAALAPESMTVHTLSIKRSSLMHLWQAGLPDGDMVKAMVQMGLDSAMKQGMAPYYLYRQKNQAGNLENVGYAKPGCACVYNYDMMEDIAGCLALGAGAISKRVSPGRLQVRRAPNIKEVGQYIQKIPDMLERKRELFLGK